MKWLIEFILFVWLVCVVVAWLICVLIRWIFAWFESKLDKYTDNLRAVIQDLENRKMFKDNE